jgi:hypothetical protein
MKKLMMGAAMALALGVAYAPVHADAAGCLKGAAVGGIAGHMAGHHGLLGAGAGCAIGHHEAAKHAREDRMQAQQNAHHDGGSDNDNR